MTNFLKTLNTFYINANGLNFHVTTWGKSGKPVAVLHAGTGLIAATWDPIAVELSCYFCVYAIERRGHGWSNKPESGYEFYDFAEDLIAVLDALNIEDALAIGHSAGGTDFLTAASLRPDLFRAIFLHEPTFADPAENDPTNTELPEWMIQQVARVKKRRAVFSSREEAFQHFSVREPFTRWSTTALAAHVHFGLSELDDGQFQLSCHPGIETQILHPIYTAMENQHKGDSRGSPFIHFTDIQQPVGLAHSDCSGERFKTMLSRAQRTLPNALCLSPLVNTHHCAPQENPQELLRAIQLFLDSM